MTTSSLAGSLRSRRSRRRSTPSGSTRSSWGPGCSALNDIRLVIGTKLDVSEDPSFEISDDDPDAPAFAIYAYLGWLLEQVVDALNP